jgi:hypothetical protein
MTEHATGINTRNATAYVATQVAAEQADGNTRLLQIVSITAGKITGDAYSSTRTVSSNDSLTVTTISGNILVGDNSRLSCYVQHTQSTGSCLVTPLLCGADGKVIGTLETKQSNVMLPLVSGTNYISNCLSWSIMDTGAWYTYTHIYNLSDNNTVTVSSYTF